MNTDSPIHSPDGKEVGRRLKMARKWRNLQLEELAGKSGLTAFQLERYETDASKLPFDKLLEMSQILELPIDYFFKHLRSSASKGPPHETN